MINCISLCGSLEKLRFDRSPQQELRDGHSASQHPSMSTHEDEGGGTPRRATARLRQRTGCHVRADCVEDVGAGPAVGRGWSGCRRAFCHAASAIILTIARTRAQDRSPPVKVVGSDDAVATYDDGDGEHAVLMFDFGQRLAKRARQLWPKAQLPAADSAVVRARAIQLRLDHTAPDRSFSHRPSMTPPT